MISVVLGLVFVCQFALFWTVVGLEGDDGDQPVWKDEGECDHDLP